MKIAVCVPHTGFVRAECARSLNALVAHTAATAISYNGRVTRPKFEFLYAGAGPLEYKRTQLALTALQSGADYHLLVDWDHVFPPDALVRLVSHDKPFVAANYPSRHDRRPTALRGQDVPATGRGLELVAATGLGFALIERGVFEVAAKPWFQSTISPDGELLIGEDVHFCNRVRAAGLPVFVDHNLVVGHIADTVLTLGEGSNADTALPAAGAG